MQQSLTGVSPSRLAALRGRWLYLAAAGTAAWLLAYLFLAPRWEYAIRWLALSGLVWAYQLWVLWRHLPENRPNLRAALEPSLGAANRLTVARGLGLALLAGFVVAPWPEGWLGWLPAALYTVVAIADGVDGVVARRTNSVTLLGSRLDVTLDGLGIAAITLLAVSYGQVPWWFIAVGAARYLFLAGVTWRERRDLPTYELPPSVHRRIFAGMLMGLLTVVLWPIVPPAMATVGAAMVGLPLLLGFLRDWLLTSGALAPADPRYRRLQQVLFRATAQILPLVWRAAVPAALLLILAGANPWWQPAAWVELFTGWNLPAPRWLATVWVGLTIGGILLLLPGIAVRAVSLVLLFPTGFTIATGGLTAAAFVALVGVLWLVLLGPGLYARWTPEDALIVRRSAMPAAAQREARAA